MFISFSSHLKSTRGRGGGPRPGYYTRSTQRSSSSSSSSLFSTRRESESTWRDILETGSDSDDNDDDRQRRRVSPDILRHGPPPPPTSADSYPTKWTKLILLEFHDALAEFQRRIDHERFDWDDAAPVYITSYSRDAMTGLYDISVSNQDDAVVGGSVQGTTTANDTAQVSPAELVHGLLKLEGGGWVYIARLASPATDEWPIRAMAIVYNDEFQRDSCMTKRLLGRALLCESFTTLIYRYQSLSKFNSVVGHSLRSVIESGSLVSHDDGNVYLPLAQAARQSSQLNDSQWRILTRVTSPVDFVQGPPGTGKSTFIVELVTTRVPPTGRVLICTTTNKAIDSLTEKLAASGFGDHILAFGNASRLGAVSKQFLLEARVAAHPTSIHLVEGALNDTAHRQWCIARSTVDAYTEQHKQSTEAYTESPTAQARSRVEAAKTKLLKALSKLKRCASAIPSCTDVAASHPLAPASVVHELEHSRRVMLSASPDSDLTDACARYAVEVTDARKQITLAVRSSVITTAKYIVCTAATAATIPDRMKRESEACDTALRQVNCTSESVADKLASHLVALGLGDDDSTRGRAAYTFEYVILDESGAMLEPDVVATVIHGWRSLLLVGDHRQLPPFTKWRDASRVGYDVSLLKRLSDRSQSDHNLMTTQYRMPSPLATLVSTQFYDGKLVTATSVNATRL